MEFSDEYNTETSDEDWEAAPTSVLMDVVHQAGFAISDAEMTIVSLEHKLPAKREELAALIPFVLKVKEILGRRLLDEVTRRQEEGNEDSDRNAQ